jgi:uncharacterized protein YbjT (DUF2867 family)
MILVTGARGRVGHAVLDGLLAAGVPADRLRASGRDPSVLDVPAGVATVAADLADPSTLPAAFDGVEQAFLYASGDGSVVAEAARAAGVGHVVLLSSLSVLDDDPEDRIGAMHRGAEAPWKDSEVTATFLRPGAFAANTLDWADGVRAGLVELPYPDSHVTPIHEADIADVAVAALTETGHCGATYELTGPRAITFEQAVDEIARATGQSMRFVPITQEEHAAVMDAAGVPADVAALVAYLFGEVFDGRNAVVADGVPRAIGRAPRDFADFARDAAASGAWSPR